MNVGRGGRDSSSNQPKLDFSYFYSLNLEKEIYRKRWPTTDRKSILPPCPCPQESYSLEALVHGAGKSMF